MPFDGQPTSTVPAIVPDQSERCLLCLGDPGALAALRPCRFCGRADALTFHTSYSDWLAYEGDEIARDADGEELVESFDAVECHSCCATAPWAVWQAEGDVFAGRRREAYAEHVLCEGGLEHISAPLARLLPAILKGEVVQ